MKTKSIKMALACFASAAILIAGCAGQKGAQNDQTGGNPSGGSSGQQSEQKVNFPTSTIRIIAPYAPGGSIDIVARTISEAASKYLPNNPTIVVDNKTGGGGVIGTTEMVKAKPDGYTLAVLPNGPTVISPHLGNTSYTIDDMTPVMRVSSIPQVLLVREDAPWKTFDEWFAYVKANPDKFTVATSGTGTTAHLALEAVNYTAGIKMKHVPFDGSSTAINALMGGHVDGAILEGRSVADGAKLRAMFTTGKSDAYPEATVLQDKGINVKSDVFNGIFAPKDLPKEILDILYEGFKKAAEDPKVAETLGKNGIKIAVLGPDEFKKLLTEESNTNKTIIEGAGLNKK